MKEDWAKIKGFSSGKVKIDQPGLRWGHKRYRWFSDDETYRYLYSLHWGPEDGDLVCWILFNPSLADDLAAEQNHNQLNPLLHYSKERLGMQGLAVVNLFSYRDAEPKNIKALINKGQNPVGLENDRAIAIAVANAKYVMAAWGINAQNHPQRVADVRRILGQRKLHSLGCTKDGHPFHPGRKGYGLPIVEHS